MGQLEELQNHRLGVMGNIEKSFGTGFDLNDELEKARSGIYADTAENRRLNRVGQKYGSEKKPDEPKNLSSKKSDEKDSTQSQKKTKNDTLFKRIGIYATGDYAKPEFKKEIIQIAKNNGINMPDYPQKAYLVKMLRDNDSPKLRKELVDAYVKHEGHYEDEDLDRGEESSKDEQGSYQKMATEASDNALKRAAADENADPKVRKMAQDELQKRGGGKENGSKEMSAREKDMRTWSDNHLKDILNDEDRYTDEDRQVAKDELEKRSGFNKKMEKVKAKFSNMIGDKKYFPNEGAIDAYLNYVRQSPEIAYKYDSENPELAELIETATKEMGIKLPPREEVINQRKEQEERERKKFEEYQKKERKKMEEDPIYAVEHSVSLEWGEPEGRKGKALMKDVKNAAKNFLKKNPGLELTIEDWEAIAEGEPDELEDFSSLEGYQELSDAIDAYVDR